MQMIKATGLALLVLAGAAVAAEPPFTGAFNGRGRACFGGFYIREKTVEWISTFSICKPSRYEVLAKDLSPGHQRIAVHIRSRSRHCLYEVFEAEQIDAYNWGVNGYQSLASYENRKLPDWSNSPLEERWVLSCPMVRLN
jgi:hypothetical protein